MELRTSTTPDERPLMTLLKEIAETAITLPYAQWSLIVEDLCEIKRRYVDEQEREE